MTPARRRRNGDAASARHHHHRRRWGLALVLLFGAVVVVASGLEVGELSLGGEQGFDDVRMEPDPSEHEAAFGEHAARRFGWWWRWSMHAFVVTSVVLVLWRMISTLVGIVDTIRNRSRGIF